MGKGTIVVLLLVIMAIVAIELVTIRVNAEGEGTVRLALNFAATVILVCFVFLLALYLAHRRTRRLYIIA